MIRSLTLILALFAHTALADPVKLETRARIEAVIDERVYVSVPVAPEDIARLIGAREVTRAREIADGTVFEGRYRMSYPLGDSRLLDEVTAMVGKDVVIDLFREEPTARAVVTRVRIER